MKKMLASDFDKTLLFDDKLKEGDIKAINTFQDLGHLFGVCTGRSLNGILRPSQPYPMTYDFYILLSGALILDKDFNILFEKQVSMTLVKDIYAYLNKQNMTVVSDDTMYRIYKDKESKLHGQYIDNLDDLKTDKVSAFSFHYQTDELDKAKHATQLINKTFGQYVEAFQNNQHVDVVSQGCSKGKGIEIIREHFLIDQHQTYGIGDSWNDLTFLQTVHTGFTFPYAPLSLQNISKHVVDSVESCIESILHL